MIRPNPSSSILKVFLVFLTLLTALGMVAAQTSAAKDNSGQDSSDGLDGRTESILVDGKPVLRILSRKGGSSEVRLTNRDGQDTLTFSVHKILGSYGKLHISKTKVVYTPDEGNKQFFSVEKSKLTSAELKDKWRLGKIHHLLLKFDGDEKPVLVSFNNLNMFANNDQGAATAATSFMYLAVKDFDAAIKQFNKLTAAIRPKTDEEIEAEENAEEALADVRDRYDKFKDVTLVQTSRMLARGAKRSIRIQAEYKFAGKTPAPPASISLQFYSAAVNPFFRAENLDLNFIADGARIPLGAMKLADEEKTKTVVRQTVSIDIPVETFKQISSAKSVEFQIGNVEYKFTDIHLEVFRKLLGYKVGE